MRVTVAEDGSATLLFPAGIEAAIVSGETTAVPVDAEDGDDWMRLRISEDVLFAAVRRVVQLTGRRIPDAVVSKVETAADLGMCACSFVCSAAGLTWGGSSGVFPDEAEAGDAQRRPA